MAQPKRTQRPRTQQREVLQDKRYYARQEAQRKRKKKVRMERFLLCLLLIFAGTGFLIQGFHSSVQSSEEKKKTVVLSHVEEYPASLITLLENNPETADFVKNYRTEAGKEHKINLSSEVKKGTIPAFLQWDERWGYETYGSDMLAITGCGPTSLSMVVCGLTGDTSWSPLKVAEFAEENEYYEAGSGSKWSLMSSGAKELGLTAKELPLDENRVKEELEQGNPIICIMGPGDFTAAGHYIVMRGLSKSGQILINDPNSKKRTKEKWNFEDISSQIRNLWVYHV